MYILNDAFVDVEEYHRACDELESTESYEIASTNRDDGHFYEDD